MQRYAYFTARGLLGFCPFVDMQALSQDAAKQQWQESQERNPDPGSWGPRFVPSHVAVGWTQAEVLAAKYIAQTMQGFHLLQNRRSTSCISGKSGLLP